MTDRHGVDDASNPGLAINWTLSALCLAAFVGCSSYTQLWLLKLERNGNQLQMLHSPHVTTLCLLCLLINQIPLLVNRAGNGPFNCQAYVLMQMLCTSIVVGVIVFSTLRYTQRLAQVQCFQQFLFNNIGERSALASAHSGNSSYSQNYQNFVKNVARWLRNYRVHCIAAAVVVFGILLSFTVPADLFAQEGLCRVRAQRYLVILWFGFVIPYFIFLRNFFRLTDPYRTLYKLKVETLAGLLVAVSTTIWEFEAEPVVGTSHSALMFNKLFWILQMAFWYAESCVPLQLTLERIELRRKGQDISGPSLLDTLSDPVQLNKFARHLIKEWSIENLDFLKATFILQFEATRSVHRILKLYKKSLEPTNINKRPDVLQSTRKSGIRTRMKAWKIYSTYIADWAMTQVTLGISITSKIHYFFKRNCFDEFRLQGNIDSNDTVFESTRLVDSNKSRGGRTVELKSLEKKYPKAHFPEDDSLREEATGVQKQKTGQSANGSAENDSPNEKPLMSPVVTPSHNQTNLSSSQIPFKDDGEKADPQVRIGGAGGTSKHLYDKAHLKNDRREKKDSKIKISFDRSKVPQPHQPPQPKPSMRVSNRSSHGPSDQEAGGSGASTPKSSHRVPTPPAENKHSVMSRRRSSGGRNFHLKKRIRAHDLKAFCSAVSAAAIENVDNTRVNNELKEAVLAMRNFLKEQCKSNAPDLEKQLNEANCRLSVQLTDSKETKWREAPAATDSLIRAEIMEICTHMMDCSQIFEEARSSVFTLMENDSHRRFVLKLQQQGKTLEV